MTRAPLELSVDDEAFLADHTIRGRAVLPAVWALELLARLARRRTRSAAGWSCRELVGCRFARQLPLATQPAAVWAEVLPAGEEGGFRARLWTERVAGTMRRTLVHAEAELRAGAPPAVELPAVTPTVAGVPELRLEGRQIYGWIPFGPAFHNAHELAFHGAAGAAAMLRTAAPWPGTAIPGHGLVRDAGFHAACCFHRALYGENAIPEGVERMRILRPTARGQDYRCQVVPLSHGPDVSRVRLVFTAADGGLVELHDGVSMRATRT